MNEIDLIRQDLVRIEGLLRAAIGARYSEFEPRLQSLLRELEEHPTRFAAREVRALIAEYLNPDVAWRIETLTSTLATGVGVEPTWPEPWEIEQWSQAPKPEPEPGPKPEPTTGATPGIAQPDEPPAPVESMPEPIGAARGRPPLLSRRHRWFLPDLLFPRSRSMPERAGVDVGASEMTYVTVPVWYATDRKVLPWEPPERRFGADMSIVDDQTVMNYGTVDVSIPKTHEIGRLESPKWYRLEFTSNPERHIVVQNVTQLSEQTWIRSIRERVGPGNNADLASTDTSRDILIFIHGYRTTWAESARRAAQFAYDLRFDGLPMLYSWPSRGDVLSYTADESASAWSAPHFTGMLKKVLAESGARRVHLVAHSMGNRVSTEALKVLALEKTDYPTPVREVVFAAPDIDRHTFREFVTAFNAAVADFEAPRMPRLTLYACGVDSALDLSRRVHRLNRAGDSRKGIVVALPMDTIEVARRVIREESHDSIGHAYFCSNSVVIADLIGVVLNGQRPTERAGLAPKTTRGGPYWRLVGDTSPRLVSWVGSHR